MRQTLGVEVEVGVDVAAIVVICNYLNYISCSTVDFRIKRIQANHNAHILRQKHRCNIMRLVLLQDICMSALCHLHPSLSSLILAYRIWVWKRKRSPKGRYFVILPFRKPQQKLIWFFFCHIYHTYERVCVWVMYVLGRDEGVQQTCKYNLLYYDRPRASTASMQVLRRVCGKTETKGVTRICFLPHACNHTHTHLTTWKSLLSIKVLHMFHL